MELANTVDAMTSDNYKDRFIAEYHQTKIRYNKLHSTIIKMEAGTLGFEPVCSLELLQKQARAMGKYLHILEVRAEIENIDLILLL